MTEMGGGESFDSGAFDSGGSGGGLGSGGLDAGGLGSGSLDAGSADLGSALSGTGDLGTGIGSPTPDLSPGYDAFANSPTMTMPGDTGGGVPVIGGIGTSDITGGGLPVIGGSGIGDTGIGSGIGTGLGTGVGSGLGTGLDAGLPGTATQSFSAFTPPGAAIPGTPGTSTLGTDNFALTPSPTYPSSGPGAGLPAAPPIAPAPSADTAPTAPVAPAPVAADGQDWAAAQPTMTLPDTAGGPALPGTFASTPATGFGGNALSGGFMANLPGMQAGATSVQGLAQDGLDTTQTLGGLTLGLPTFAAIGSDVGVANGALQSGQTTALTQLLLGMKGIGMSIGTAADGYGSADQAVAQGFGALGTPTDTTSATTPAAPTSNDPILNAVGTHHYGDTGADVTAIQNQLNAAGYNVGTADGQWGIGTQAALAQYAHDHNLTLPAQPNQLDQRAIDQILNAEGNNRNFTQGGRHEIFGIREGNPGYTAVNNASQAFGQNSAGERAAASQVVQNAYNNANLTGFTDPGEQAAIASAIHMRGPGGASSIVHAIATGQTDSAGRATPQDLQAVQALTPDQFQTQFRSAREAYDIATYGNTTTNHGGVRQNWWTAYGTGLQNRYNAEERLFRGFSGNP